MSVILSKVQPVVWEELRVFCTDAITTIKQILEET
jgi:hypothetical protein